MAILNNSNAISTAGGYDINNSLRFRSSASAYLNRTPASAGNRQIMTYSFWIKRGAISGDYNLTNATTDASNSATFYFNSSNNQTFDVFLRVGGTNYSVTTSQLFRDPSAWYHIVVAIDTTQATASNRTKVYVNGSQVTNFLTANYVPQNSNLALNNNVAQYIGFSSYFDGYMTEINFVNAQQLTPSSFGETSTTTGSWVPKAYTGTYGTNGFYLNFSDIATTSGSNAGLGKDFSGNANYWTTNNISVTAGTTYDAMIDSPTLTSATVANYAVLNPLDVNAVTSITEANLYSSLSASASAIVRSTIAITSGKWYWEVKFGTTGDTLMVGVCDATTALTNSLWSTTNAWMYYSNNGNKYNSSSSAYGATFTNGDIIGVALDMDAGTLVFYKNNVSQGTAYSTGLTGKTLTPTIQSAARALTAYINFGQRPFEYTPPTGFVRLNTYNLPDSTIKKGSTVMDATLYTGTGSSQSIVNVGGFKPDFVWMKTRNVSANSNLVDSVRGVTKLLQSNTTGAEATNTDALSSFNSNGFTVVSDYGSNYAGNTYVGWQWQAGQGSTSSNTSGSITSTVSVNTTAGFSVVTYTGTGANATVGHGLGVAPKMIIVKSRSTAGTDWPVYHASLGATGIVALDTTIAFTVISTPWNNTAPTSSVFTVGTSGDTNLNTRTYVAYCWAEIAGYSKAFSYTGNGSTDGSFVFCGFRPKFVLLKSSSTADDWYIHDSTRNTYNVVDLRLSPNLSSAEVQSAVTVLDFLSNGFKLRTSNGGWNGSGNTYIGIAFAENPFKNALAR